PLWLLRHSLRRRVRRSFTTGKLEAHCEHRRWYLHTRGMDHCSRSPGLGKIMCRHAAQAFRTHYLLEIAGNGLIENSRSLSAPDWVAKHLRATPFVVVRRGPVTLEHVPIGVRGANRNQRWAASCRPQVVKRIITPPQ